MTRKKTHKEYEQEIMVLELDLFPVDTYVNAITPILHECWLGHQWHAKPTNILHVGTRCPVCYGTSKKPTDSYKTEIEDRSVYIVSEYITATTPVEHGCKICNSIWKARPTDILKGKGCPKCASRGFDSCKPAITYFISFIHDEIVYYKVGITNKSTEERLRLNWKSNSVEILWEFYFKEGKNAAIAEKRILDLYDRFKINTGALSSGNTETFTVCIDKEEATIIIGDLLNE